MTAPVDIPLAHPLPLAHLQAATSMATALQNLPIYNHPLPTSATHATILPYKSTANTPYTTFSIFTYPYTPAFTQPHSYTPSPTYKTMQDRTSARAFSPPFHFHTSGSFCITTAATAFPNAVHPHFTPLTGSTNRRVLSR